MALINCPECGRQVSDKAVSCPGCGYAVAAATVSSGDTQGVSTSKKVQTVELTAKRYKLQQLLAALLIAIGVVIVIGSPPESKSAVPGLMIFAGLVWFIVARILIWWHHR